MTFGSVINTAQPASPMNAASNAYSIRSWAPSSAVKRATNPSRLPSPRAIRRSLERIFDLAPAAPTNLRTNRTGGRPEDRPPVTLSSLGSRRRRTRDCLGVRVQGGHVAADGLDDRPRHHRDERREQHVLDDVLARFLTNETIEQVLHDSLSLHMIGCW